MKLSLPEQYLILVGRDLTPFNVRIYSQLKKGLIDDLPDDLKILLIRQKKGDINA